MQPAIGHDPLRESATSDSLAPPANPQTGHQPAGLEARKPLTPIQHLQWREQIKQAVIAHYRAQKENYPTFIRQRRDLIIGRVMNGSSVEEAFLAEASRRR